MYATTIQLSEEIGMYVDELRAKFSAIEEVWLVGSRVDSPGDRDAPWEFLVMADQGVLEALRAEPKWQRDDVELLVVTDGDHFEAAWGAARDGSLKALGWGVQDAHSATFDGDGGSEGSRRRALRVR